MARPDYCPLGNEPCQGVCAEPCLTRGKTRAMRAALLEARAFIAEQRKCHVECSAHFDTHQMDPDDFDHAEDVTALLQRIDTALGGTPE